MTRSTPHAKQSASALRFDEAGPTPPRTRWAATMPRGWSGWSIPWMTPSAQEPPWTSLRGGCKTIGEIRLGVANLPRE